MIAPAPLRRTFAVLVIAAVAVAGCSTAEEDDVAVPDLSEVPELSVGEVAWVPEMVTDALVLDEELVLTGRDGRIFRLPLEEGALADATRPELPAALDLRASTSTDGERGLFNVEPVGDGVLAISRTGPGGEVLVELVTRADDGTLAMADRPPVLEVPHDATYHNGGALVADGDDLLVSLGDNEEVEGDPAPAQDPADPLGSVVRIPAAELDPTSQDGPFQPGPDDLIAIGLRNPWRMSLDPGTDALWMGEVGAGTIESVEVLRRQDGEWQQANFGWPVYEGRLEFRPGETLEGVTFPVFEREHADDVCAIIGGYVDRGDAIPGLEGAYLYGDYCSTELRAVLVNEDGEVQDDRAIAALPEPPVSIVPGPDGRILVLGSFGGVYAVGPEGGEAVGTTVAPVDLPEDELCELQDAFLAIGEAGSSGGDLSGPLTEALAAAEPLAQTGDRAAVTVREGLAWAVQSGSDPAQLPVALGALTSGDGEHAYVSIASAQLLAAATAAGCE